MHLVFLNLFTIGGIDKNSLSSEVSQREGRLKGNNNLGDPWKVPIGFHSWPMAPWHLKWGGGLILTTETSPRPQMIQVVQEPHLLQTLLLSLLAKLIEDIASLIRQRRKTKKKKHNETAPPPRCLLS